MEQSIDIFECSSMLSYIFSLIILTDDEIKILKAHIF